MPALLDPRLEAVARTICSVSGGDADTDWPRHVKAAAAWLRNVDRNTPANDAGRHRIPIAYEIVGEEAFPL